MKFDTKIGRQWSAATRNMVGTAMASVQCLWSLNHHYVQSAESWTTYRLSLKQSASLSKCNMSQFKAVLFTMLPIHRKVLHGFHHGFHHSLVWDWCSFDDVFSTSFLWFVHATFAGSRWFQHPPPLVPRVSRRQFFACAGDAAPKMETQGPAK